MGKNNASSRNRRTLNKKEIMERVQRMMEERGAKPLDMARKKVLQMLTRTRGELREALNYLLTECWQDLAKPALIPLSCETVGGKPETTIPITAAITLVTIGVGVHDDIIDQSKTKGGRTTIFGKFGMGTAIVAGRTLMIEGLASLFESGVPTDKIPIINSIIEKGFRELGNAEGLALELRGRLDVPPQKYMRVMEMKASIYEAQARVGAIMGDGAEKEVAVLGEFGRILGVLVTIRDEFVDMFDAHEIKRRMVNECLPLPVLYALQNVNAKGKILAMLGKEKLEEKDMCRLREIVFETKEVKALKEKIRDLAREVNHKLTFLPEQPMRELLELVISCVSDI